MPAMLMAPTIAQGTAVAAFDASSLMWTLESKEPTKGEKMVNLASKVTYR
jgi:2-polyprenyl-6-methoxyphenol hydroxylase-like FAD-dependent oxidoreductase